MPRHEPHRIAGPAAALVLAILILAPRPMAAQSTALSEQVDRIFTEWDRPDSPGCALGVVQGGELIYTRGYGSANLDYEVPLTSRTVFYLASVSKQFVAAAVTLAAEQGRLSLDDDIRRYVPELPDYGEPITVRHLIHHTSGLRDYLTLMRLAGMRYEDVHPEEEILELIVRQKELNFGPGEDYLYSNTGYFLLAVILERATGLSLREFTTKHFFQPLGMENTHFHDDAYHVQKNRAVSYQQADDGEFRISFLANFDQVGSGGLYSTVEDLYRWDQAFYDRSIGGPNFIDTLHTRGILDNGDTLDYAFGLDIGEYRGLRTVGHNGSMMGFRTALLRFPDQRFSVICLCNLGRINPMALARKVADVYLADAFPARFAYAEGDDDSAGEAAPEAEAPRIQRSAEELRRYAGAYYSEELDATYRLTLADDALILHMPDGRERTLTSTTDGVFEAGSLELHFDRSDGPSTGFRLMAGRVRNLRFTRR